MGNEDDMANKGVRLWKMYEQEADEAWEAAAVNHARGPEYRFDQ